MDSHLCHRNFPSIPPMLGQFLMALVFDFSGGPPLLPLPLPLPRREVFRLRENGRRRPAQREEFREGYFECLRADEELKDI